MAATGEYLDPNKGLFAGSQALTFDDVLVVPGYSEVLPDNVDTTAVLGGIELRVPLISQSQWRARAASGSCIAT
jgi:IMP dehydrogenase/GMP reductase